MLNVGIGLTSKCNCECEHCYSRIYGNNTFLDTNMLYGFLGKFEIGSVNFGTGESYFHPDFLKIIKYLSEKGIKISLTTNGYTTSKLKDDELKMLHDVDFSLDYPEEGLHDRNRKLGCFNMVMNGIQRCKKLGITCSVAWCLTPENCIYIKDMLNLCKKLNIFLRVNIYKPIDGKPGFSYDLFWNSINNLFLWGDIISISEGIVNAAIGNERGLTGCSCNNLRIFPNGTISSCVYIPNFITLEKVNNLSEKELIKLLDEQYDKELDGICLNCEDFMICKAGCMARRKIAKRKRDEFCFVDKMERPYFDRIVFSKLKSEMFVHSEYICTIILEPRRNLCGVSFK